MYLNPMAPITWRNVIMRAVKDFFLKNTTTKVLGRLYFIILC